MAGVKLSEDDVRRLLADPSPEARVETAVKITSNFGEGGLTESERRMAEEIFRIMVKDAEVRVREALAQNLKENPRVPHDVAKSLASDVDTVALPVLLYSEVLTDRDLVEIVQTQGETKQIAVSRRSRVSEAVSQELVETHNERVVTSLVSNVGADISEESLQKVVDEHGESEQLQSAIVRRPKLPVTVAERLVTIVSDHLQEELARRHAINPDLATDLILRSRERAVISISTESEEDDVDKLVRQMRECDRLTPSIMLRALCMGDMRFFEASIAELAGVPLVNARQLLHDSGELGLKALFGQAGLPEPLYPAILAATEVAKETDYDGEENDRERYSRRMLERVLTQYGDLGVHFDSDDLEYLLGKMEKLPSDVLKKE